MLDDNKQIFALRHGRIVGSALQTDRLGFLQAIGVVPPDASSSLDGEPQKNRAHARFVRRIADRRSWEVCRSVSFRSP